MRSFTVSFIGAVALIITSTPVFAQSKADAKADAKYRAESEELRKQVWAWDRPEFKKKDIPAEYANASKIIIAHHTELSADSKSKLTYYGLGFGTRKETSIIETVREMIKVNDKTAVEDYSELSFTRLEKRSGFYAKAKSTTFV